MALNHSPKITTNGLVLCLDAGNPRSYSGSGVVWRDLIYGDTATLNDATFVDNSFLCSRADWGILANNTSLKNKMPSKSVSHFTWVYPISEGQIVTELGQTAQDTGWYDSNIEISSSGIVSFSTWHGSLINKVTSSSLQFNNWYNLCITYDDSIAYLKAYIDGLYLGQVYLNRSAPQEYGSGYHYSLCSRSGTNMGTYANANAKIANFCVYNRALSPDEVLQNYNALKGRFQS